MKVCVTMKLIIHANFESDTPKFCKAMDYQRQILNFHTNKYLISQGRISNVSRFINATFKGFGI